MEKEVKIYTTPVCPKCQRTKEFFEENDIEYKEIDVTKDMQKAKEMFEKSGKKKVPVIVIGDKIITKFDKEEIKKALEK